MPPIRLLMLLLISITAGCNVPRVQWHNPGSTVDQRNSASLHDPYADNDAGPVVEGQRPRDFQKPFAEPKRSQQYSDIIRGVGF